MPIQGRDGVGGKARGGKAGRTTEAEGVKVAVRYLRAQGYRPKDMGTKKVGHDILLGRQRIEVKASEHNRAWTHVDIRKACIVKVNKARDRATVQRSGLNFDGLLEVTRMRKPGGPLVYFYPRRVVQKYGQLHLMTIWYVFVPPEEREKYRLRLQRPKKHR